jgi:isoleucyl-tRNA synthetase
MTTKNNKNHKSKKKDNHKKHIVHKKIDDKPDFLSGEFNFVKTEEDVLRFWDDRKIFEKSLDKNKKKQFVFFEGPPYANGKPGIHHVLARIVKDVILRYKTMNGYYVPRRAGWDTHGLPVEMAVEKELGFKSKNEIENYGIEAFNKKAKEQVWLHKDEWENITRRIGYWLDLKNAYVTYDPEYIETIWWSLSKIAKRNLLFKGHKVVPWCTRCGTALSSHELAQGYKEVQDNSVYIKFKLKQGQKIGDFTVDNKTYILSWTTTPWTLPGNIALAVGKDIDYVLVEKNNDSGEVEKWILASDIYKSVLNKFGIVDEKIIKKIKGNNLLGLSYEPLFDVQSLVNDKSYKIYDADFVTTTDGTGVVHTAVMYGEDDFSLGKKIGLLEKHTVDENGKFKEDVPELMGMYVKSKETEEKIFNYLTRNKSLLFVEKYTHEYPHCWRCGTPVLYYARTSWFIGMSKLRKELLARNKNINWIPQHVKNGRFGEWLKEAKDWNLSRERYWGAPLPIWECSNCGNKEVVGSIDELNHLAGGSKNNYWVMRHGEAMSNILGFLNSQPGDNTGFHLTEKGKRQVKESIKKFKEELKRQNKKIDLIIASDVLRTKETQNIVKEFFKDAEILLDKNIEEIHLGPKLEGCNVRIYGEQFPTYESRFEKKPEEGESLRDLRKRVWNFLQNCEEKYQDKNILIISHEYPIWMLFQSAEGWSQKRAIIKKEEFFDSTKDGSFIYFSEIRKLDVKVLPRDESGEIDMHKPYVDSILFKCSKCGSLMRRVPEVADVWYDSGAMPFAQAHWPFNKTKAEKNKLVPTLYPADYIAEGMDQTRGWFYTLLSIATAMGYPAPYKNVVSLGLINDKYGQKMSKSKGNTVDPWEMISKYGIDAIRWYFFTGSPLGEPKNFDDREIAKSFRKMHLIVYNSFVFWRTYAIKFENSDLAKKEALKSKNILDVWIIARLNETIQYVSNSLDKYEIRDAAIKIEDFVDDLSRWYIRRSRRRLQPSRSVGLNKKQKEEMMSDYKFASATLQFVLLDFSKVIAPFTPFFAEMLYSGLYGKKESVHLDEFPKQFYKKQKAVESMLSQMSIIRDIATLGLSKRAEIGIKIRQPLASLTINPSISKDEKQNKTKISLYKNLGKEFLAILQDEVNVKKILFDSNISGEVVFDTNITDELKEEGFVREFTRSIQELRQSSSLEPKDEIIIFIKSVDEVENIILKNKNIIKNDVSAKEIIFKKSEDILSDQIIKIDSKEILVGIKKV